MNVAVILILTLVLNKVNLFLGNPLNDLGRLLNRLDPGINKTAS